MRWGEVSRGSLPLRKNKRNFTKGVVGVSK